MKTLKIFFFLFIVYNPLFADSKFCIQVTAAHNFDENKIKPAVSRIIKNYDKARIDKRNGKLVLRVGNYDKYSYALKDLSSIQKMYGDAYIRRCDYVLSKVIYPKQLKQYSQTPVKIPSRRLQSQIIQPKEVVIKKRPKRRMIIVNGKVQIVDETNNNVQIPKRELHVKRVPRYDNIPTLRTEQKISQKRESFIYNKNNKYNKSFFKDCKKCYAPIRAESDNEIKQETQQQRQKITKVVYNTSNREDTQKKEKENSWISDMFPKEEKKVKKNKIKYTYIDRKPKYKKDNSELYFNQKVRKKREIEVVEDLSDIYIEPIKSEKVIEIEEIEPEFEYETDLNTDINNYEEDIFSDEISPKPTYKAKEQKQKPQDIQIDDYPDEEKESSFFDFFTSSDEKKEEEVDIDIDINDDVEIDMNIEDIEDYQTEKVPEKEKSGFFDFLKKPLKQERVKEKKIKEQKNKNYEEYELIDTDTQKPIKEKRQEPRKKLSNKVEEYDLMDSYESDATNISKPITKEKKRVYSYTKPQKYDDYVAQPIKQKNSNRIEKYDLMDSYESDATNISKPITKEKKRVYSYTKPQKYDDYVAQPIKQVSQIRKKIDSYKDEYQNQYMFENSNKEDVGEQPYFNKNVQKDILEEKEPEELYKNQYMFENREQKQEKKSEVHKRVEEKPKGSFKNQYMYQHAKSSSVEKTNKYNNNDYEDETELYKNQYMYQNSSESTDPKQPFFTKEKKDDSSNYDYKDASNKKIKIEEDDDY